MIKKLIYISHWRIPSDKTMSPLIMKTCESLAKKGVEVELWVPRRMNAAFARKDPFTYHHVEPVFTIKKIPTIDLMPLIGSSLGFFLMVITFNISIFIKSFSVDIRHGVYFSHDFRDVLFLMLRRKAKIILEVHDFYKSSFNFLNKFAFKRILGFVVTNIIKMQVLKKEYGIYDDHMVHLPNAVDADQFNLTFSQDEARTRLGLPRDQVIVMYTGHLFGWKGVYTLAEAAKYFSGNETVYFVGGIESDRQALKTFVAAKDITNVVFLPHQDHLKIPLFLKSANVLVLPNTAKEEASRLETSPVKLFEYMASGIPIVASDLPSIRNIVDDSMVTFFEPDNPESLAYNITLVLKDGAQLKSENAQKEVLRYTWDKRGASLKSFIDSIV